MLTVAESGLFGLIETVHWMLCIVGHKEGGGFFYRA